MYIEPEYLKHILKLNFFSFRIASYLLNLSPYEREVITRFRCCQFKLPIETGRWENIPRENRLSAM